MVHQLALYKLRPEVTDEILEEMIRRSRSLLLKAPEVLAVRSGRTIDPNGEWPFFVGIDFDSRAKQRMLHDNPIYLKYLEEVVRPYTLHRLEADYETEPGRDVRYS